MWFLRDENNGKVIYLKPNVTMTVGRNKGDIVLPDDKSISRVHAHIIIETLPDLNKITEKTQPLSNCIIKDSGSKYGNFLLKNDVPMRISEEGLKLQHKDRIRFGLQNNIFTVNYIPIITATSGMSEVEKEKLKKIIDAIDGKMIYVWTPLCTHMTVVKPTISEKLSCALSTLTPIVSFDYWDSVTKAFEENKEFPDAAEFCSSIDNHMREIGNVSVRPNPARKTLFQNRTFVHFSNKQYLLYSRMIKFAGGKSLQFGKQRPLPDVCDDNVIVVQFVESNTTQATGTGDANYAAVCEKLRGCRRRTIPESEIAIALLHCSTTKYCNPKYDYAVLFAPQTTEIPPQNMTVLAVDTQDMLGPSTSRQNQVARPNYGALIIPETLQDSCDLESQPAKTRRENFSNDSANIAEAKFSESAEHSSMEDSPSESEIGSMKLASFNYEGHLREEFNKRAMINEESIKRRRDNDDDKEQERKKKICLGVSSIYKPKECNYEKLMPNEDDGFLFDAALNELGKKQERLHDEDCVNENFDRRTLKKWGKKQESLHDEDSVNEDFDRRTSKKLGKKQESLHDEDSINEGFDRRTSIDKIVTKRNQDREDDQSKAMKKKSYHGLSSIDNTHKRDYKDMMLDDHDAFLLDESVCIAEKDMGKEQELQTPVKILAAGKDLEEVNMLKQRKSSKIFDNVGEGNLKSTSAKNSNRNRIFETETRKPSEYSNTDEQENSFKQKAGRSDISPFSDVAENSRKRTKSEIANERHIDSLLTKSSTVKRPLMDLPLAPPNLYKSEINKEDNWIINASIEYGSEKDTSAASDSSPTSLDRNKTNFFKFPNDPNATLRPLLRIDRPSDIQIKNGPRFGKCFRKQKIKIPVRIELDGSTYDSWNVNKKPSARLSMDDDDRDQPQASPAEIPDVFFRAKKICRI